MVETKKAALHYSILSGLSKCSLQVKFRYVDGLKIPPGKALHIGTAVHKSVQVDLTAKMQSGSLLELGAVEQAAAEALDANWAGEGVLLDEEDRTRGESIVRAESKDEAVALARLHHDELAPRISPISVEQRLRLELNGFPFDLEGTTDIQELRTSGLRRIADTKTAKKSPSGHEAESSVQLDTYTMMANLAQPELPRVEKVGLHYLVKTKAPKAVVLEADAATDFEPIVKRIEAAAKVFETGAFYPADPTGPSSWVCSAAHCGFWKDVCPFGRRARRTISMNTNGD